VAGLVEDVVYSRCSHDRDVCWCCGGAAWTRVDPSRRAPRVWSGQVYAKHTDLNPAVIACVVGLVQEVWLACASACDTSQSSTIESLHAHISSLLGVQSLWQLIVPVRLFGQLTHTRLAMLMAYAAANLQGAE
jgi:hypothetical protein